jgi:hypothetical protein
LEYFNRLAALTYHHWNAGHRDAAALTPAAMRALAELPAHEHVRASDIVDWAASTPVLPPQLDPQSQFGDPPVTVYNDGCLVIDVYFWLNSSTSIHQHAFAGAFFVLEGASVETEYDFETERRYSQSLSTGRLHRRKILLNKQGDCRPILPGAEFIHSLFHLDYPSVSLVVRTNVLSSQPQLEYWWPRIAIQTSGGATPLQRRRLELLTMLGACRPAELPRFLRTIFAGASPQEVLWAWQRAVPYLGDRSGQWQELLHEQRQELGPLIDDALDSFDAEGRLEALAAMRQCATSSPSRLLLALLLNARGPRDLLTLIEAHSQCADPIGEALRMAAQLLSEAPLSARGDLLPPQDFPLALSILRQFLREVPLAEVPASLAAEHREISAQSVHETCRLLAESTLFRNLCQPAH